MALEVYYPQDIRNALLAAQQANDAAFEAVAVTDDNTAAFRRGYHAALMTLALAFGLVPSSNFGVENEAQDIRGFPHNLLRADWRG